MIDRQGPHHILLVCSVLNPHWLVVLVVLIEVGAPPGTGFRLPLATSSVLLLLAIILCYSIAFGLVEIGVIEFTEESSDRRKRDRWSRLRYPQLASTGRASVLSRASH